jgi:hypothetical protein
VGERPSQALLAAGVDGCAQLDLGLVYQGLIVVLRGLHFGEGLLHAGDHLPIVGGMDLSSMLDKDLAELIRGGA